MRPTTLGAVFTASALALVLTGCFTNPLEQLAEGGAEEIVEQVTGGNVDVGADGTASVPADFPADVPLPPGSPTTSLSMDGNFQLNYAIADLAVVESLRAELTAAGFAQVSEGDMGELKIWAYETDVYVVGISVFDNDGALQLAYTVATKE